VDVTSSRAALLTRHFFRRFLDNDLISPNGDAHVGLSQTLAAIVTPGLLLVMLALMKYGMMWRATWGRVLELSVSDSLLYVSLSMIVLAMAATISWDAFFLDARDRYILAVLPVPERLLSAAKLAALGLFLAVFVVAANLLPALVIPGVMLLPIHDGSAASHAVSLLLAHAAAVGLAGAWAMLAIVGLRGALALVLPARLFQRVSPLVQGLLVVGLLGWMVSLSPFLDGAQGIVARGGPARDFSPPLWFLGVYQWIAGNPWPEYGFLAETALRATVITLVVVLVVFLAPRQRRSEHVTAAPAAGVFKGAAAVLRDLAGKIAVRHPLGRASFAFTLTAMGRSAKHRLYLAGAFGAGLAWAATGLVLEFARSGPAALGVGIPSTPAIQVQLVLVLFLVVAVRFGALVPATLPANWLFRVTEQRPVGPYFAGARRAALAIGLLPVAAFVPAFAVLWGWRAAAYHGLTGAIYAGFVVELLFNGMAKMPCAATYVSGRLKLKSRAVYYLVGAVALTGAPALLESAWFRGRTGALLLPLLLVVPASILALSRWRKERTLPGLVFDDSGDEAVQTLRLSE
jgi:hypothetical protein